MVKIIEIDDDDDVVGDVVVFDQTPCGSRHLSEEAEVSIEAQAFSFPKNKYRWRIG